MGNQAIQLLGSHGGWDMEGGVREQFGESGPVSLVPGTAGGDKFKAKSHVEMNGVVVLAVIGSINPPDRDGHREVPGKSNINVGLTK